MSKETALKRNGDFGQGPVALLIAKQALPLTASQLAQLVYSLTDRIYIGHIGGNDTTPLTGLGLTFPIVSIITAFTLLFGQGGAPLFSIARGEGNNKKASDILYNSFMMLVMAAAVLTLSGYIFMKPLLYQLGASDASYPYAASYLNIYLLGTIFTMLATGLNFYITAQGFPKTAMITVLSGAFLNMALDPLFIFAFGMGIKGAATATIISQFASCVWVLLFLTGKKALVPLKFKGRSLNLHTCGKIISMGFTGFVMEITNAATQIVCNKTLVKYGKEQSDTYIMIMTIISSVRSVMSVAVNGITSGAQPVIGFNYGAKKYDRVKKGIRTMAIFGFVYTAVAWLIIFLFPGFFISLFSKDAQANAMAVPYLHIFFMAYVFMSLQFAGQSTFMSLGKAPQAIFFSLLRKALLVIPLTIILPMYLADPISGVFWAEPVSNIIGGSASFFTMFFTVYRKLGKESK